MSIQAIAWVLDKSLTQGSERLVLIAIANHVDSTGWCWPSIPAIAHEARVDKRTVYRAIDALEEWGDLRILRRPGKSNLYGIAAICDPAGGDNLSPPQGVTSRPKGVTSCHSGDDTLPPESKRTIKNHPPRASAREWTGDAVVALANDERKRGAEFMRNLRLDPKGKKAQ